MGGQRSSSRDRGESRFRQRSRKSRRSPHSVSSSGRRQSPPRKFVRGGFDQRSFLPEAAAGVATLARMTSMNPIEAFLAQHPFEPRAASWLRRLPPDQQQQVIQRPLLEARNPTAVLLARIRSVASCGPAPVPDMTGYFPPQSQTPTISTVPTTCPPQPEPKSADLEADLGKSSGRYRWGGAVQTQNEDDHPHLTVPMTSLVRERKCKVGATIESKGFSPDAKRALSPRTLHTGSRDVDASFTHGASPQSSILMGAALDDQGRPFFAPAVDSSQMRGNSRVDAVMITGKSSALVDGSSFVASGKSSSSTLPGVPVGIRAGTSPGLGSSACRPFSSRPFAETPGASSFSFLRNKGLIPCMSTSGDKSPPVSSTDCNDVQSGSELAASHGSLAHMHNETHNSQEPQFLRSSSEASLKCEVSDHVDGEHSGKANRDGSRTVEEKTPVDVAEYARKLAMATCDASLTAPLCEGALQVATPTEALSDVDKLLLVHHSQIKEAALHARYQNSWVQQQLSAQLSLFEQQRVMVARGQPPGPVDPTWVRDLATKIAGQPMLPGDWTCPNCGREQLLRNHACRGCGMLRPPEAH